MREALFSRVEHEGHLEGSRVLDLYAGSGALGLEAASRGAAHVLLVEQAPAALVACRRNAAALGLEGVVVRAGSVAAVLAQGPIAGTGAGSSEAGGGAGYDLVLADPPYDLAAQPLGEVLAALVERGWLAAGALVVVERSTRTPEPTWPDGLACTGRRRYGETVLYYAEPDHAEPDHAEPATGPADPGR